mgnify:FL=1
MDKLKEALKQCVICWKSLSDWQFPIPGGNVCGRCIDKDQGHRGGRGDY